MWGTGAPRGWKIVRQALPVGVAGLTDWRTLTITISPEYPAAYQRMAFVHECVHVERGPVLDRRWTAAEERAVEKETARRLIALDDLAEAMVESDCVGHLAETLHVDTDTLLVRLADLRPAERAHIQRRLASVLRAA